MLISRFLPIQDVAAATWGRFRSDIKGIAAVEFGLIAPVALIIMLGLIETGRALVMARRFALVTAGASDVTARSKTVTNADLDGIATAVRILWNPYDATTLNFTIMQFRAAGNLATKKTPGQQYIEWARQYVWQSGAYVGTDLAASQCVNKTLQAGMIPNGSSAIYVQSNFTFAPLFTRTPLTSNIMPASTWNWGANSTHVPRLLCVDKTGLGCVPIPGCEN